MATGPGDLWRLVRLSFRREPGVIRLCRRAGLQQSLAVAVRRDAAVQDASAYAHAFRGRPPRILWRAGVDRGRRAVDPEADLPRRAAAGRYRGILERAEGEGLAHRDEVRHRRGGSSGRG